MWLSDFGVVCGRVYVWWILIGFKYYLMFVIGDVSVLRRSRVGIFVKDGVVFGRFDDELMIMWLVVV